MVLRSGVEIKLPTVRAFFRALQVYGREIYMVREAIRKSPSGTLRSEIAVALFLARPADLIYVLEGLAPKEALLTDDAAQTVALGFVALLAPHLSEIDTMLGRGDASEADVDAASQRILRLAKCFQIDPMTIPDWPLGVFIDAWNEFTRDDKTDTGPGLDAMVAPRPAVSIIGGPERAE